MDIWTVYWSPNDFPGLFVARRWTVSKAGVRATEDHFVADYIDELRMMLPPGLVRMQRDPDDDPVIYEVWL